jgi:hypothetical protein
VAGAAAPLPAADSSRAVVTGRTTAGAIVLLEPVGAPVPLPPGPALLDQYGKAFVPDVLFVRVGQVVEFRNSEDVDHNVRVLRNPTGTMVMDVSGSQNQVFTHTFDRQGTYEVTCDVHPGMRAMIVAARTPFAVETDARGAFTIADVPAGAYKLTTLVAGQERTREVTVAGPSTDLGSLPR